jgi:RimJ/RimL family protein N-acetyltransferase
MSSDAADAMRPAQVLRGRLVYLRAWERSDLATRGRWLSDGELLGHLEEAVSPSAAEVEAWFEPAMAQQGESHYRFVVCRLEDDVPIGSAWLDGVDRRRGAAELGIYIAVPDQRSRGVGTDALGILADLALGQLRLERLWLLVFDWNDRAIRSYEKAGFVREGTLRHWTWFQGRWQDVVVMSLLHDEWARMARPRAWEGDEAWGRG